MLGRTVRALAMLSMHTSPLAQPGTGDGGGMNVYVRELATALARTGVQVDVYTRADDERRSPVVAVEPGLNVHHVPAGPLGPVAKEDLPHHIGEFAEAVQARMLAGHPADLIHANYWLSGVAGHELKHALDLPLVCTFHTLDRVKAEVDLAEDSARRADEEARIMGCSDRLLASCEAEREQVLRLYAADPERIAIVPPGVDHAFFAPGDRSQARRAVQLPADDRILLFVGRIQPLKGIDVAVRALASIRLAVPNARLVVVGGPSGPDGESEYLRIHALVDRLGLSRAVTFVSPQPHELLSTYYRAAEVCLVPSRTESFGLVALEAKACGTPVVASSVGGLTSLVEHGVTGFLVDDREPDVFAKFAVELLSDDDLARQISAAAAHAARGYTWREAAGRLRRLYDILADRALVDCD